MPIRYKFVALYSLLFALAFTVSSIVVYWQVRRIATQSIRNELRVSSRAVLGMVRAAADISIRTRLRAVAESNRQLVQHYYQQFMLGHISEEEAKRLSKNLLLAQQVGKTGYIYAIDSSGTIVFHPRKSLVEQEFSRFAFIRKQMRLKHGYLEYEWKNPDEEMLHPKALYMVYFEPWDWIISATSYREEFRELVRVDDFRDTVESMRFGESGYTFVIDSRGNAVIHPSLRGNFYNEQDADGKYFVQEMTRKKRGITTYRWQDPDDDRPRRKLAVYRYVPELDWIVVSSGYQSEFYAPLESLRNIYLAVFLVTLVAVLLLSWKLAASVTRPVDQLIRRFQAGADGDLGVRAEQDRGDEIGQLAEHFNTFMRRLKASRDSLREEIAERKRAEEQRIELESQLRHSTKMEAIGQLAGGIAHDFNNILTAIRGNAQLISMSAEGDSDITAMAEQISTASTRAADLTSQLLAFARKRKLQVSLVNMHQCIEEVVKLLRHSIDKRIALRTDLQADRPTVHGDSAQLQNALLNFALNARDAMPEGGTLTFTTRNTRMNSSESKVWQARECEGEYVEIAVSDTGCGMSEEVRERIFEPFFTTKEVGKGTGLGLAGVYGCVKSHNGMIRVESAVGEGSTFIIALPVSTEKPAQKPAPTKAYLQPGTGRVMLVDDEEIVRNFAKRVLESQGYDVIPLSDGTEAVEYFRQKHLTVDLVILDMVMPRMDGPTTLKKLRQIDPAVRVLLASGFSKDEVASGLLREGANGFLGKPFSVEELCQAVSIHTPEQDG
ncbi:MAG: cache domain-containing protein [Phycisphaerae bacterium]